ncbi:glycosyltransferase family 4 protein [Gemmatimonadota bacterium]
MDNLRVLFVSDKTNIVGGGEISLLHLIGGLQLGGGVEPILAVPSSGELSTRAEEQDIPTVILPQPRVKARPWSLPRLWRQGRRLIDEVRPDIIHVNSARSMLVAGIAGHRRGIPVVWHVRVEGQDTFDRWLAARCTLIITPTRVVASRYPTADVRVIPNPVDIPVAGSAGAVIQQLREQYHADDGSLLLTVALLSADKGYIRLLEALSLLDQAISWQLLIAGREAPGADGFREKLEGLIREKGLQERVRLLGFREDVPVLMMASDLLIHVPHTEGFGRVYIEAMAVGLPAVISPAGGLRELHEETGYGWIATDQSAEAIARAIEAALGDPRQLEMFRTQGPLIARERFSIEQHAARVRDVYRDVLGMNDRKAGPGG